MKTAALGILLLAHGGDPSWNKEVRKIGEKVGAEVALGMADPAAIQAAVDKLEKKGAKTIIAVPLFINSSSEVLHQTRYVLGLEKTPSELAKYMVHHGHGTHGGHHAMPDPEKRVKLDVPVTMTSALDDHALVAAILKERADALGEGPVVLVAHGPTDEKSVAKWQGAMESLARQMKRDVVCAMLRDDAAPEIRARAVEDFRSKVAARKNAVVVPLLIARGGIEKKIPAALQGLAYRWDGRTLTPHPNIQRWVEEMTK